MGQLFTILFLILYTLGCGVKGAPLPRQNSAYIFNQNPSVETDTESTPEAQTSDSEEKKESIKDDQ